MTQLNDGITITPDTLELLLTALSRALVVMRAVRTAPTILDPRGDLVLAVDSIMDTYAANASSAGAAALAALLEPHRDHLSRDTVSVIDAVLATANARKAN